MYNSNDSIENTAQNIHYVLKILFYYFEDYFYMHVF